MEKPFASAAQHQGNIDLVADATGVGVWMLDLDTGMVTWNRQMWRIYGLPEGPPAPPAPDVVMQMTHPDDRERLMAVYQGLIAGEPAPDDIEYRLVRPDGEVRWVVARARTYDARRRFGVTIDLTEQRRAQQRLAHAEHVTALAAQALAFAIWEQDAAGGGAWWSEQMYRLRGLSPNDPRPPAELWLATAHPEDRAALSRHLGDVGTANEPEFEFRVVWPDGSTHWLATRASPRGDADGQPPGVVGFNWDVSQRRLTHELQRARAEAETASRAKSVFVARMSHELRTPLNAVLGFSQLLHAAEPPLAEVHAGYVEHIAAAGEHLLGLIEDALDLTSIELGGMALSPRPLPLAPLVAEILQWVLPASRRAGVAVVAEAFEREVVADPLRLRQVLANLLSNAIKYNRPGGRVDLRALSRGEPPAAGFAVRDTGRGMTPEQLGELFQPFNRLGAENDDIEGTGIGLAIVRALVRHMGGSLEVDSAPGVGTEFRVWLPAAS